MLKRSITVVVVGAALALGAACGSGVSGGDGGAGGKAECSAFADEKGSAVEIVIRNAGPAPVYLNANCSYLVPFEIRADDATDPASYPVQVGCSGNPICETLQHMAYSVGLCGVCPDVPIRIDPGQTYSTSWEGTGLLEHQAMPEACWYSDPAHPHPDTCERIVAARAGTYRVRVKGYQSCNGCLCNESPALCEGDVSGAEATSEPATLTLPSQKSIELVFGACAFGCPDAGAP